MGKKGTIKNLTDEEIKQIISESYSYFQVQMKIYGFAGGGGISRIKRYVNQHNIDISHFNLLSKSSENRKTRSNFDRLYDMYQRNARRTDKEFLLSINDFVRIINQPCHYCGNDNLSGVDRINSKLGYSIQNCLPCCTICNFMKSVLGYDFFIHHIFKMNDHLKRKLR